MFFSAIILAAIFFIPWRLVDWGKIQLTPARMITVTGEAQTQQKNQIASFSAGVYAVNDDKDTAVNEVNVKVEAIIAAVKNFGIGTEDIQTENLSVYRAEETYWEDNRQKSRPGQWRVNNSISLKLRDVDRASDLTNLLTDSGATNISGPRFALDDTGETEEGLLAQAVADARQKAELIAAGSQGRLGRVISVTEGYQASQPVFYGLRTEGVGGGAPVEPGSATISKTVTVVFELK